MKNRKNTIYDEENTKMETKVIGYAWGIDFSSEKVFIQSVVYSPWYDKFGFIKQAPKAIEDAFNNQTATEQLVNAMKKMDIYSIEQWNNLIEDYNIARSSAESIKQKIMNKKF